ncbi:MAG: hypothetical protein AB1656_13095 [Candidatus Omnitrophota bacterium]
MNRFYPRLFLLLVVLPIPYSFAYENASPASPILIQPQKTKLAELFAAMLDRDVAAALKNVEDGADGMTEGKTNAVKDEKSFSELLEPKGLEESKSIASDVLRWTADLAGTLGCAYSLPDSKYYRDAQLIPLIETIFEGFEARQTPMGGLLAPPNQDGGRIENYEIAECYESLLSALAMTETGLEAKKRKTYRSMLEKGLQFLLDHQERSVSYRGMIGCGTLALGYAYTGDRKYLEAAKNAWAWLESALGEEGEPAALYDMNLDDAADFLQSLFLYRLMSGDAKTDEKLITGLRWYARLFSPRGVPLAEIGRDPLGADGALTAGMLGALSFYSAREPELAQIASRWLEALMERPSGFTMRRGGGYFLRGALYLRRQETLKAIPYAPYAQLVRGERSLRYLVGKNYQTAVNLIGKSPWNGMQAWSYKGQPPLIYPSLSAQSRARGFGYDSHVMDSALSAPGPCKITPVTEGIDVLITPQGDLVTGYVFSQDATIIVYYQKADRASLELSMQLPICAKANGRQGNLITFQDSEARILLPQESSSAIESSGDDLLLRSPFSGEHFWITFAGPETRSFVRPVGYGLALVHLLDGGKTMNILLNLSKEAFSTEATFPGTSIPIPDMEPFGAAIVEKQGGKDE